MVLPQTWIIVVSAVHSVLAACLHEQSTQGGIPDNHHVSRGGVSWAAALETSSPVSTAVRRLGEDMAKASSNR